MGYTDGDVVKPLCIMLPQMSGGYTKCFDNGSKSMLFVINNNIMLVKYNEIQDKIRGLKQKEFNGEPAYENKYVKLIVRLSRGVAHIDIHGSEVPKEGMYCVYLLVITIDSTMKINGKYYPKVYLEQCKYVVKEDKLINFKDAELELDSSNESNVEQLFIAVYSSYILKITALGGCFTFINHKHKIQTNLT